MKSVIIALAFVGSSAFASTNSYVLEMDLSLNGKHISSPRVVVMAGETATVTQKTDREETFIEVVATEGEIQNKKGILMKMVVGVIEGNGQRTVLSRPQVLTKENEPALIQVGDKDSKMALSVVAKRKSL